MKRFIAAAAGAVVLAGLAGCTAAHTDQAAAAPAPAATATPTPAPADPAATLKTAMQSYSNAFLEGNIDGALAYLHKDCQGDADRGSAALSMSSAHTMAKGATMTIDSVVVTGDRGRVDGWHLSAGAPDALRRLLKQSADNQAASMPWRYIGGEWYFRSASCTGGAAS